MKFTVDTDSPTETTRNFFRAYLDQACPSAALGQTVRAFEAHANMRADRGADSREVSVTDAILLRLKAAHAEVRAMESAYVDGPIPDGGDASMVQVARARAVSMLADCRETYGREMAHARDAIQDKNPNEYAYRMLRANAAVAQAIVWSEILGMQDYPVAGIEAIMTLADQTRLAFEPSKG